MALSNDPGANEESFHKEVRSIIWYSSFKFDFHRYEAGISSRKRVLFQYAALINEISDCPLFVNSTIPFSGAAMQAANRQLGADTAPDCLFVYLDSVPVPFGEVEKISEEICCRMGRYRSLFWISLRVFGKSPLSVWESQDEINSAIVLTIERMEKEGKSFHFLFEHYKETGLYMGGIRQKNKFPLCGLAAAIWCLNPGKNLSGKVYKGSIETRDGL